MKNFFSIITLCMTVILFSSCSKEEENGGKFDYDIDLLIGTWRVTHIENKDGFVDITQPPFSNSIKATYATFNSNGTYSGKGYFGDGSGTYKTKGKTITCYIDGEKVFKYEVVSLINEDCELRMTIGEESTRIKCKKQ